MTKELQDKAKQYDEEAPTKPKKLMKKELLKFKVWSKAFVNISNKPSKILQRKKLVLRPILEKAKAAIEKVSRAQGYDYTRCFSRQRFVVSDDKKKLMLKKN